MILLKPLCQEVCHDITQQEKPQPFCLEVFEDKLEAPKDSPLTVFQDNTITEPAPPAKRRALGQRKPLTSLKVSKKGAQDM